MKAVVTLIGCLLSVFLLTACGGLAGEPEVVGQVPQQPRGGPDDAVRRETRPAVSGVEIFVPCLQGPSFLLVALSVTDSRLLLIVNRQCKCTTTT